MFTRLDSVIGAGIAFPYPFGYPIVNKVLVDWSKSASHVVISTKTEAKLARLILQDFVKVCITWLDPHLRPVERKSEPVFGDSFSLGSHQPSKAAMVALEGQLAESRAALRETPLRARCCRILILKIRTTLEKLIYLFF